MQDKELKDKFGQYKPIAKSKKELREYIRQRVVEQREATV